MSQHQHYIHNKNFTFTLENSSCDQYTLNIKIHGDIGNPNEVFNTLKPDNNSENTNSNDPYLNLSEMQQVFSEYFNDKYIEATGNTANILYLDPYDKNLYHYDLLIIANGNFSDMYDLLHSFEQNLHASDYNF